MWDELSGEKQFILFQENMKKMQLFWKKELEILYELLYNSTYRKKN